MAEKIRKHVYIAGRVQGVGFRASVKHKAQELNIKGWVKNISDGRVEAVFAGVQFRVEKMIAYVKNGPRFARVDNIEIQDENYTDEFNSFFITY